MLEVVVGKAEVFSVPVVVVVVVEVVLAPKLNPVAVGAVATGAADVVMVVPNATGAAVLAAGFVIGATKALVVAVEEAGVVDGNVKLKL